MIRNSVIFTLICTFFLACSTDKNLQEAEAFFDLKTYFNQEIERLPQMHKDVLKVVYVNDEKEEKKIVVEDWNTELKAFLGSDINRSIWLDKYTVDSILNDEQQLVELQYELRPKEALKTQKLDIKFEKDKVHSIVAVNHIDNSIYTTQEFLEYIPTKGYTINQTQVVSLLDTNKYSIEVKY